MDIDEKWFYMTRAKENYFLVCGNNSDNPDESPPARRTRNKHYIEKVLFLCAQARPRWDAHRNAYWDGKIGIWPVGTYWMRTRGPRTGSLMWEDQTITQKVYRKLLLEKVVPVIELKWPRA